MKSTADKIRELSTKAAAEKAAQESKVIQDRIDKDMEVLEKILQMVKERLVYKEVRKASGGRQYIVVTEEIVLADYAAEPSRFSSRNVKIERIQGNMWVHYNRTEIEVNGNRYYHAADMIERYKYEANTAMEKAKAELDAARRRKEAIESMAELEPVIKELTLNYNKHLGYLEEGQS